MPEVYSRTANVDQSRTRHSRLRGDCKDAGGRATHGAVAENDCKRHDFGCELQWKTSAGKPQAHSLFPHDLTLRNSFPPMPSLSSSIALRVR
jgi:hypothetical protein